MNDNRLSPREKKNIQRLNRMIKEKKPEEPVGQVLVKFCTRSGVSMDTCREYYRYLVAKGKIKGT